MRINLNLVKLISGSVLICGLIACSSDKNVTAWRLQEPIVESATARTAPIEIRAVNKMAVHTEDELVFSSTDIGEVSLSATSECSSTHTEYATVKRSWPLRRKFHIYEFLPFEALFDSTEPQNNNVKCRIHFEATNSSGSVHDFDGLFHEIDIDRGDLPILKDGAALTPSTFDIIEIKQKSLATFSLPVLENSDLKYQINCEQQTGFATATPYAIHFDQFAMQNAPANFNSNLCRIFKINGENKILAISDLISWRSLSPEVKIDKVELPAVFNGAIYFPLSFLVMIPDSNSKNRRLLDSVYKLTNTSTETIHVVIPNQSFEANLFVKGRDDIYDHVILQSQVGASNSSMILKVQSTELKIDVPAGQTVFIEVGAQLDLSVCNATGALASFEYWPLKNTGLNLYLEDDPKGDLKPRNIVETLQLEPQYKRWLKIDPNAGWADTSGHPDLSRKQLTSFGCANEPKSAEPANNKSTDL
jgi:hypothetical protein